MDVRRTDTAGALSGSFDMDAILPLEFYIDDTRMNAGIRCPRCNKDKNTVFGVGLLERMVICVGCRACKFRWWKT